MVMRGMCLIHFSFARPRLLGYAAKLKNCELAVFLKQKRVIICYSCVMSIKNELVALFHVILYDNLFLEHSHSTISMQKVK